MKYLWLTRAGSIRYNLKRVILSVYLCSPTLRRKTKRMSTLIGPLVLALESQRTSLTILATLVALSYSTIKIKLALMLMGL